MTEDETVSDDSSLTLEDGLRAYRALLAVRALPPLYSIGVAEPIDCAPGQQTWIGTDLAGPVFIEEAVSLTDEKDNGFMAPQDEPEFTEVNLETALGLIAAECKERGKVLGVTPTTVLRRPFIALDEVLNSPLIMALVQKLSAEWTWDVMAMVWRAPEPDTRPRFPSRALNADNHRQDWAAVLHSQD